ncbi:hypothetical protein CCACVL1_00367, partial [Corchorus capsularis]
GGYIRKLGAYLSASSYRMGQHQE